MDSPRTTHVQTLIAALRRNAAHFGPELASLAAERGLAFTNPDGTMRALSIAATPVVLPASQLIERLHLAEQLTSAATKMARATLAGPDRELLLAGLSPLERRTAELTYASTVTLATSRVDFVMGKQLRALEINATIPAMQGYSDIAAHTFLDVVGRFWKLPAQAIADLQASNGSNPRALHQALLAGYRAIRPGRTPNRIALLCRRFDAQSSELLWLRDRFREFGSDADVVHPDQLAGDDAVRASGKTYDLIYRHLFVRRLEDPELPGAAYVTALLHEPNGTRAVLLNPPASQIEEKLTFALLSTALEDPALRERAQLSDAELDAIARSVPWTRSFCDPALVERVAADPDRHVLKRNWDYGGRTVFVGRIRETAGFRERVRANYGEDLDWTQLCARALADCKGGGFVVQELVDMTPEPHVICSATSQAAVDLYVDFSCYASVGLGTAEPPAWTGVCRGSTSPVVNLHSGGGVLPLLTDAVAERLYQAALSNGGLVE
jgi:hypothetical protein